MHTTGDCLRHKWYRELSGISGRASAWVYSHQSFGQWSKFLANLGNLLSRNLGKTPVSDYQDDNFHSK